MNLTLSPHQTTPGPANQPDPDVAARAVNATKVYGKGDAEVRALDGVTGDFATSRFSAIMGPSGSGKSTLMHALAGLDSLTSGSVWIAEVELSKLKEKKLTELRRDSIGFIFQAFNLVPTLTAAENIELPLRLAGKSYDQISTSVYHSTDAEVRSAQVVDSGGQRAKTRGTISASTLATVRAVKGVQAAEPQQLGVAVVVGRDGKLLDANPNASVPLALGWQDTPAPNPMRLVSGHGPRARGCHRTGCQATPFGNATAVRTGVPRTQTRV